MIPNNHGTDPEHGGEVKNIIGADLALADAFAVRVRSKYNVLQRNLPNNLFRWFYNDGAGDYLGRPDNKTTPTIWFYNEVNSDGFGPVATWFGVPTRISKISNFMVAYGFVKIGTTKATQKAAQLAGTKNDPSAKKSWEAGEVVAGGADYTATVSDMVKKIFDKADVKNQKLWPNPGLCDNHVSRASYGDPDREFSSVGFLEMTTP